MSRILKYPYPPGATSLDIPWTRPLTELAQTRVIHVAAQRSHHTLPTVWVEHPADLPPTDGHRTLHLIGTGQRIPDDHQLQHVGSAVCLDGALVWHVYAGPWTNTNGAR